MARARSLKPGFFTNDELAQVQPLGRLLFAGLWCLADRAGRLEDRPVKIKAQLLPYDNCDCNELLDSLEQYGFILRYQVGGEKYIQIRKFDKHQNPHIKEADSTIPEPCENSAESESAGTGRADSFNPEPLTLNPIPRVARAKFDDFWKAYPRKEAKDRAEAWWKTHKPTADDLTAMLAAIDWQRRDGCLKPASADGRSLVPLPASWLNAGRWKDERPGSEPKPLQPQVPRCIEPGCPNPGAPIWNGKCAVHHAHSQAPKRVAA